LRLGSAHLSLDPLPVKNAFGKEITMPVLNVSQDEYIKMKAIVMDRDKDEALALIKEFLKRLELEERKALKSHLD
jgi:hypothetical protein